MPLADPVANRAHIEQFLRCGMTDSLAWNPVDGRAGGPWYPVNQEKLVGLIYHHVRLTGDTDFLRVVVDDQTILDHVMAQALCCDDPTGGVIDYGPAGDHLELRREHRYHHVMPDLNARQYQQYEQAAELADWAGNRGPTWQRAADLETLREQLWNPELGWFDCPTPARLSPAGPIRCSNFSMAQCLIRSGSLPAQTPERRIVPLSPWSA